MWSKQPDSVETGFFRAVSRCQLRSVGVARVAPERGVTPRHKRRREPSEFKAAVKHELMQLRERCITLVMAKKCDPEKYCAGARERGERTIQHFTLRQRETDPHVMVDMLECPNQPHKTSLSSRILFQGRLRRSDLPLPPARKRSRRTRVGVLIRLDAANGMDRADASDAGRPIVHHF
jgi:hypothetical protein